MPFVRMMPFHEHISNSINATENSEIRSGSTSKDERTSCRKGIQDVCFRDEQNRQTTSKWRTLACIPGQIAMLFCNFLRLHTELQKETEVMKRKPSHFPCFPSSHFSRHFSSFSRQSVRTWHHTFAREHLLCIQQHKQHHSWNDRMRWKRRQQMFIEEKRWKTHSSQDLMIIMMMKERRKEKEGYTENCTQVTRVFLKKWHASSLGIKRRKERLSLCNILVVVIIISDEDARNWVSGRQDE